MRTAWESKSGIATFSKIQHTLALAESNTKNPGASMKLHITSRTASALILALGLVLNARAVDIVAHGGASFDAPGGTLAAERLAWEQKADVVASFIRLTADGKIIVTHDGNVKHATGRDLVVENTTFDALRALDAGALKSPRFAGEKLPTLEEQIALTPPGKRLLVEIKAGPEIVPELARCMERCKAGGHNVTFISFDHETLKAVRKKMPSVPLLYVVSYKKPDATKDKAGAATKTKDGATAKAKPKSGPAPAAKNKTWTPPATQPVTIDEAITLAKAAGFEGLDLQKTWPLDEADVRKIKDAGLQLHVWSINDPEEAKHWIALGATSITTDRPGWLREKLGLYQ